MIFKKYIIIGKNLVYKRVNWPNNVLVRCNMCVLSEIDDTNIKCIICCKISIRIHERINLSNLHYIEPNTYVFTKEI